MQDPGITVGRLEGDLGGRLYDKETGRNCQYGLTQQVEIERQWPTIRASDAQHGGPNQRGSKGDLMLPSAVVQEGLWRTPTHGMLNADRSSNPQEYANRKAEKGQTITLVDQVAMQD